MERLGARFESAELIIRSEAQDDGARAGFDVFLHPVDHFIPSPSDTQHGVGDRFIGAIVILREKSLAFDDRVFAAGREGKVNACVDRTRITSSIRGVSADLLPTFSENIRALDVVDPSVTEASDALEPRLHVVRSDPDRHAA